MNKTDKLKQLLLAFYFDFFHIYFVRKPWLNKNRMYLTATITLHARKHSVWTN